MDKLTKWLDTNNIEYRYEQIEMLKTYMETVLKYNEHINLTAIKDRENFVKKHYIDSLTILNLPEYQDAETVIDLGTGGGFPGVPLAIMSPEKDFTLVDSLRKRMNVVEEMMEEVGIFNGITIHGRAEELGRNSEFRDYYDICVSRAVANLSVLAEYCLPFVRKGGYFIAYKGSDIDDELKESKTALKELGGKVKKIVKPSVSEITHSLIIIKKEKSTPKKYPRQAGKPAKEPIK